MFFPLNNRQLKFSFATSREVQFSRVAFTRSGVLALAAKSTNHVVRGCAHTASAGTEGEPAAGGQHTEIEKKKLDNEGLKVVFRKQQVFAKDEHRVPFLPAQQ
jgi:hypothetical protein